MGLGKTVRDQENNVGVISTCVVSEAMAVDEIIQGECVGCEETGGALM